MGEILDEGGRAAIIEKHDKISFAENRVHSNIPE